MSHFVGDEDLLKKAMSKMLLCLTVTALLSWSTVAFAQAPTSYTATWASIDQHPAAPDWYKDGKLGIWFHWGAYSAPAFYSEWYPHYMYDKAGNGGGCYKHQIDTYGDPLTEWPYDKFITGGTDKNGKFVQFAPKLVADGGKWDPDAWAQLFVDAGARFAGPSIEHHDGFSMWNSKVNPWNSVQKGPKLDLAKLHIDAYRKKGLKIFTGWHHAWNFMGYWEFVPTPSDPDLKILYGKLPTDQENQLWVDKLKEVIDQYQPDIIYHDGSTNQVQEAKRLDFLAYYFNAALSWGREVVVTYKDGFSNKSEVYDYERGGPGDITTPYWQTDDTLSVQSWGYIDGLSYYNSTQIIHAFIDRVSKGGNLMLNISPMADGTIPQPQQDLLRALGAFLRQMGTAIYSTRAWAVYGEGPTKMGGGTIQQPTAGNANDVRYTVSKDGDAVYAILLGWPGNGKQVNLTAVTPSRLGLTQGTSKVFLFAPTGGAAIALDCKQDSSGLHVTLPSTQPYTAAAYAMKISKTGTEPAPTPWLDGTATPDGGVSPDAQGVDSGPRGSGGAGAGGNRGTGGRAGSGGATAGQGGAAGWGGAGGSTGTGGRAGSGGAGGATAGQGGAAGPGVVGGNGGASATGGRSETGGMTGPPTGGSAGSSSGGFTGAQGGGSAGAGPASSGGARSSTAGANDSNSGCSCTIGGATRSGGRVGRAIGCLVVFAVIALARRRRAPLPLAIPTTTF